MYLSIHPSMQLFETGQQAQPANQPASQRASHSFIHPSIHLFICLTNKCCFYYFYKQQTAFECSHVWKSMCCLLDVQVCRSSIVTRFVNYSTLIHYCSCRSGNWTASSMDAAAECEYCFQLLYNCWMLRVSV